MTDKSARQERDELKSIISEDLARCLEEKIQMDADRIMSKMVADYRKETVGAANRRARYSTQELGAWHEIISEDGHYLDSRPAVREKLELLSECYAVEESGG